MEAAKQCLQVLKEETNPRPAIETLTSILPGPLTPQMMSGIDTSPQDWDSFAESYYGELLSQVILRIKTDWLKKYGLSKCLKELFVIESASEVVLHESLLALCDGMKSCEGPSARLDFILDMMKGILSSDALVSAVISACKRQAESDILADSFLTRWEECVQLMVSLPNRIANKLKGKMNKCFTPDVFTKIVLIHIAKCLVYLSFIKENAPLNLKPVAVFLSKLISNFKCSTSFPSFFKVLDCWSAERDDSFCDIVTEVLKDMDRASVESTAILILKNCSENTAIRLLKSDFLDISSWKYALTKKIPLLTYHNDGNKVITNLIACLGNANRTVVEERTVDSNSTLSSFVLQLLNVWGDKSAMLHTPQEQHLYISKMIVAGFNYLINVLEPPLDVSAKVTLQSKLFQGMPSHLENTTENVRLMGMITAECVVKHLNKLVQDVEQRAGLEFDFSKVKNENVYIIEEIRSTSEFEFNVKRKDLQKGDDILEKMIDETKCEDTIYSQTKSYPSLNKQLKKQIDEKHKVHTDKEDSESELDSDDDLVPYDLSNDVTAAVTKRPKYLRDLIEGFREENVDVWIGSIEVCEELIYKQLPEDDVTLGIEILDILLSLEKRVYCENFDDLRFSGAVAIVVVNPDAGAQYLCQQFHLDVGKYAIATRMLMLDILSAAAKTLSSPKNTDKQDSTNTISVKTKSSEPDWCSIVKARIENHSRRFCQPKKAPKLGAENKFANVAGSFLFPLLRGSGKTVPRIEYRANAKECTQEESTLLLVHFLRTCALIVSCAVNSTAATRMGKELLEATWSFRFHSEARVREAVIAGLAAVVIAVPASRLSSEFFDELLEARLWLDDVVDSQGIIRGRSCEVDEQCRGFAAQVSLMIGSALNKFAE